MIAIEQRLRSTRALVGPWSEDALTQSDGNWRSVRKLPLHLADNGDFICWEYFPCLEPNVYTRSLPAAHRDGHVLVWEIYLSRLGSLVTFVYVKCHNWWVWNSKIDWCTFISKDAPGRLIDACASMQTGVDPRLQKRKLLAHGVATTFWVPVMISRWRHTHAIAWLRASLKGCGLWELRSLVIIIIKLIIIMTSRPPCTARVWILSHS